MFKKLVLSLLLSVFLLTSVFAAPAQAAAPKWYHSEFPDWFERVNDPGNPEDIYAERYTSAQVEWIFYGYFSFILNSFLGPDLAYCAVTNSGGLLTAGALILTNCTSEIVGWLGRFGDFITFKPAAGNNIQNASAPQSNGFFATIFLEDRPMSGISYVRERLSRFGLVQEASAQGSGFGYGAAAPVKALWVASRDITYFLLVIALIVMAFMIMFRIKTSPQTIITIQSTLPKLIVGIILITFSYAIAGFLIDLMYVVIAIVAGVLAGSGLFLPPNDEVFAAGNTGMYGDLSGSQLGSGLMGMMFIYTIFFSLSLFSNNVLVIGALLISGIGGILLVAIIQITFMIIVLKIIWALVKNFMTILLLVAAGPFMILSGVIGGSGFGGWLKTLAAHLAVYPAIGVLFAFAFFFLANSFPDWPILGTIFGLLGYAMQFNPDGMALSGTSWVPPFTVIGTDVNMIWLVISLMLLSLIPKTVEMIKGAVSGKPFAYGSAIGAPIAAGFGAATFPISYAGNVLNQGIEAKIKSGFSRVASEFVRGTQTR